MRWLLFLVLCISATAQTTDHLAAIRELLLPLRQPVDHKKEGDFGATPDFGLIKQHLREWVESEIRRLRPEADLGPFAARLNDELRRNGLRFPKFVKAELRSGYLDELRLEWKSEFLVVHTSLSVNCGSDHSAYAYVQSEQGWKLAWKFEQDQYGPDFKPLSFQVAISPLTSQANSFLVAIAGNTPYCTSCWSGGLTVKGWRVEPGSGSKLIFEPKAESYNSCSSVEIAAEQNDLWLEFVGSGANADERMQVRHYRFVNDQPSRVDPIALRPINFLDIWLKTEWPEALGWTDAAARTKLKAHRERRNVSFLGIENIGVTKRCRTRPDLYQVGLRYETEDKGNEEFYYLMRWLPPYRFTMMDVLDRPSPDCSIEDPAADEPRQLFPGRW
jgi:hypothetical protein